MKCPEGLKASDAMPMASAWRSCSQDEIQRRSPVRHCPKGSDRPADEVVAIDCETTGLNVRTDDVITIAAIKIRGSRILTSERFEAVVRPDASMRAEEIKMHRLRQADVAQSPLIRKVLPRFPGSTRRRGRGLTTRSFSSPFKSSWRMHSKSMHGLRK
jgi:DNA polymerase III epsilon subunit-like protein